MDFSWRIGGEAGYGINTAGLLFSRICMSHGLHVFGEREYPSLIRGGHNTYSVRFSDKPLVTHSRFFDVLAALNSVAVSKELSDARSGAIIIHDSSITPEVKRGVKLMPLPISDLAAKHGDAKLLMNTVVIGVTAGLFGFNKRKCVSVVKRVFKRKPRLVNANVNSFLDGYSLGYENKVYDIPDNKPVGEMLINGNTAFAIGSLRAGVNFMSAYPMTPATGIFEYIISKADKMGVRVVQSEDEISAINNILGASFTGARALTCTSGGGFALMNEALSLAGMTESPIVIALSQRPAPATGLPTRTAQGDLLFALNAGHGEFSKIVLAPGDVRECYDDALSAFNYADKFQTPVIVLLDKHLSTSSVSVKPFSDDYVIDRGELFTKRLRVSDGHRFKRYEFTRSGVSPRPVPGKGFTYCFAGDEHDEEGFIIEDADKAVAINSKRARKDAFIKRSIRGGVNVFGRGDDLTLIGWGSTKGALIESLSLLRNEGVNARFIQVRILNPFPGDLISKRVRGEVFVVENNRDGQLTKLLNGFDFKRINRFDGRPLNPEWIVSEVLSNVKS